MIIQALEIMLFGMLGIFLVMGLIIAVISLLKKFSERPGKKGGKKAAGGE